MRTAWGDYTGIRVFNDVHFILVLNANKLGTFFNPSLFYTSDAA